MSNAHFQGIMTAARWVRENASGPVSVRVGKYRRKVMFVNGLDVLYSEHSVDTILRNYGYSANQLLIEGSY